MRQLGDENILFFSNHGSIQIRKNKTKFLNPEQHDFFADTDKLKIVIVFY
jgi:hypothetical protein